MRKLKFVILRYYYVTISLVFGVLCLCYFFNLEMKYPYTNYYEKHPEKIYSYSSEKGEKDDLLELLYKERKTHYFKTLGTLDTSTGRLALLVLIAITLLYFQPEDITLFGVKIPNLAVYIILPVCILFYWLVFGYSLFSALGSRESLHYLSLEIERNQIPGDQNKVNYMHSMRNSLEDIGIVDSWSNVFFGYYDYYNPKGHTNVRLNYNYPPVLISLFVIFGGLQGLSMGCVLSMILFYRKRFGLHHKNIVLFVEIIIALCFIASHLAFFTAMPYSTLYLSSIWLFCSIFLYVTLRSLINKKIIN